MILKDYSFIDILIIIFRLWYIGLIAMCIIDGNDLFKMWIVIIVVLV